MTVHVFEPRKPLLRGLLHTGSAPDALLAGLVLGVFAPTLAGLGVHPLSVTGSGRRTGPERSRARLLPARVRP